MMNGILWSLRKIASRCSRDPWYLVKRPSYSIRKRFIDANLDKRWIVRKTTLSLKFSRSGESTTKDHFLHRESPVWLFREAEIPDIVSRIPKLRKERTLAAASSFASWCFTFRGHEPVELSAIDWDASPRGDITWTKDLNRHGWFETLGCAHRYARDDRFSSAFIKASSSWIDLFGGRIGQAPWDDPFEVARRINSWMWSFFLFLDSPEWSEEDRQRFLGTLGLLSEYLYHTLEYHGQGNHVLLEAKTLVLVGEAFPEFAGAARWRSKGWKILKRELPSQICQDGVHAERATMYHRIIAGELCELWRFCSRNLLVPARQLENTVQAMAEFQRWVEFGNGQYAMFGDTLSVDTYYRFSAPAVVEAREYGGLAGLRQSDGDMTLWLLGDLALAQQRLESQKPEQPSSKAFPDGGYFVSGSRSAQRKNILIWDCGPIGDHVRGNRTHAHADALQVVLAVSGKPMLVDPGVGAERFVGRRERHESGYSGETLRRTRAHNTVCVDGEDQAILAARGEIWKAPVPRLLLWASCEDCDIMSGSHDGYRRLKHPVLHTRTLIAMRRSYWLIVDHLEGQGCHRIEHRFHCAPGTALSVNSRANRCLVSKEGSQLTLSFRFSPEIVPRLEIEECLGELDNGRPLRIPVLSAWYSTKTPVSTTSLLVPGPGHLEIGSATETDTDCIVEVMDGTFVDRVFVCKNQQASRTLEADWITDARVSIFRYDREGRLQRAWIAGASRLVQGDRELAVDREDPPTGRIVRFISPRGRF